MAEFAKFFLIRFAAHPARGEALNVGIGVFSSLGLSVHLPAKLDKLKAITAAADPLEVRGSALRLVELDAVISEPGLADEERLTRLASVSPFVFSGLGELAYQNDSQLEARIAAAIDALVTPERAPMIVRDKRTKLIADVRRWFRAERILATKEESISSHRVLQNYLLSEGLSADFLLKNGSYHLIETVDLADDGVGVRRAIADIAVSALVIERAKIDLTDSAVNGRLVYTASAAIEELVGPALTAAEHQGVELVNWASADDQRRFIATMSSLAEPLPAKKAGERLTISDVERQRNLSLN
jgi:hypothetical protein